MSTNPSGAAVGRSVMASPDGGASPRELADLAAAIGRVAALLAADASRPPDGSDALERIADIAFVLQGRDIERSLCDALDAAVRDLGKAEAFRLERAHQAANSLRTLVRRIHETLASAHGEEAVDPRTAANSTWPTEAMPAGEMVEDAIARGGSLAAHVQEDDAFVQAVASLVASLPLLGERNEPASNQQPDHATGHEKPEAAPDAAAPQRPASEPHNLPDPDEDPGDLFEPLADDADRDEPNRHGAASAAPNGVAIRPGSPGVARENGARPAPAAGYSSLGGQGDAQSIAGRPRGPADSMAAGATPQPAPPPRANDPLAAVRALSEEEMIALFS